MVSCDCPYRPGAYFVSFKPTMRGVYQIIKSHPRISPTDFHWLSVRNALGSVFQAPCTALQPDDGTFKPGPHARIQGQPTGRIIDV